MATRSDTFLDGQLLVAMPGMEDPRFDRAVIFMCAHSEDGAMGLIINKPTPELRFSALLKQLNIKSELDLSDHIVHFGGPVEHGRGFVLHTPEYDVDGGSLRVRDTFTMTATVDILQDMANGEGPQRSLLALGYAGWAPGQLERELQSNSWLTVDPDHNLVFAVENDQKWEKSLAALDVDPRLLSSSGGSA